MISMSFECTKTELTFQTRPVTSWNAADIVSQCHRDDSNMPSNSRLVEISCPAAATPITML